MILSDFRKKLDAIDCLSGSIIDILLSFLHTIFVFFQGDLFILFDRGIDQKVRQQIFLCTIGSVNSVFDEASIVFKELLIFIIVFILQLFQTVDDLLFDVLLNLFKKRRLLKHFTGDIQRKIFTVDNAFDKLQIIRNQFFVLLCDEDAFGIQSKSFLIVLRIKIIGNMAWNVDNGIIIEGSFSMDIDGKKRIFIVVETGLIEIIHFLFCHVFLVLLPKRNHGVKGFYALFFMCLSFDCFSILIKIRHHLCDFHLNRITNEIRILLDEISQFIIFKIFRIFFIFRIIFEINADCAS